MPRIAVIGATGTAGSRTVAKLKSRGIDPVEISRSTEVDLVTGAGLREALAGVEVAIDTSNVLPTDHTVGLHEALTGATRHVVEACAAEGVGHLVFLSMIGVEKPELDDIPYYAAKRAQENIVALGPVPATTVKASRFFESATAPDAVTFERDEVLVPDCLLQPVAADVVAEVLVESALGEPQTTTEFVSGPRPVSLPELTTRYLQRVGDLRPVRTVPAERPALSQGALRAPDEAIIVGPDVRVWLRQNVTRRSRSGRLDGRGGQEVGDVRRSDGEEGV